jgi:DNA polymerase-1
LPTIPYEALCGKGARQIGFAQVAIDQAAEYAAEDADICLRLHAAMYPQIAADNGLRRVYEEIEIPVREVLFRMERTGVLIDGSLLTRQSHEIGKRLLELEAKAHVAAGQPFNVNSPKQLAEILFDRLGLPVKKKTPTGTPSTDEEVLSELALDYPLPKILLEARQLAKLKGTYTDKLPKMINLRSGRVHTSYAQAVAVTGRLASNDPNLQNIPVRSAEGRRIRAAFVAPLGARIVSADYSQIELRIMAHLSQDPRLLQVFEQGEDIHMATAMEIFNLPAGEVTREMRRAAKSVVFGIVYGISPFGLASNIGVSQVEAKKYIETFFEKFAAVRALMDRNIDDGKTKGYTTTILGRRRPIPELQSGDPSQRGVGERMAVNSPIQGSAADLIKVAMINVHRRLRDELPACKMILQVHDELIFEVPDGMLEQAQHLVKEEMEATGTALKLSVPLKVDVGVGANWRVAHP